MIIFAGHVLVAPLPASSSFVHTESEVYLVEGFPAIIPCKVDRKLYALYWKRATFSADAIIGLDLHFNTGVKFGNGYDKGSYDITPDYSLIIENVSRSDDGLYYCEVSDFETGALYRNQTRVTVLIGKSVSKTKMF